MKNRILACAAATLVAATTVSLASCSSDADSSTDADQLSILDRHTHRKIRLQDIQD